MEKVVRLELVVVSNGVVSVSGKGTSIMSTGIPV